MSELETIIVEEAAEWLESRLARIGIPERLTAAQVAVGDPATEIIAAAQRLDVDLIVLPTRGAGAVGEALIGSVARSVLRGAHCPILIVNQPME
jgi:nucleotide-binding universal stress UspA family protein